MKIVYLHGLNSSHRSFSYISASLPEHEPVLIDYLSPRPLNKSLVEIRAQLPTEPFVLIGHSLGGLLATILAVENELVTKLITISAPFAGSEACRALRWLPGSFGVLSDLTPTSQTVARVKSLNLTLPTLSIISTGGHLPTSWEPNDSVVSIASQKALPFGKKVEVKANHFEVMLHEDTVALIKKFIF